MMASSDNSTIAAKDLSRCSLSRRAISAALRSVMSTINEKHHRPVVGFNGTQSDLDRELASVFPSAKKIAPDPHRSRLRIGEYDSRKPG